MQIIIGKYVNTHGILGEIRIKSNFKFKDKVFKIGNKLIIANKVFIIKSYRVHKGYDMVKLVGIDNINQIINLKGSLVYFEKDNLNLKKDEYLDDDLRGFKVFMDKLEIGILDQITYLTDTKKLLVVNNRLIPFELVDKIDFKNKKIIVKQVGGLI